jgi:PhoH-like ATPase
MKKNYILDTNAIFEDLGQCIEILRNGKENKVYIPKIVFDEFDKLKMNPTKRVQVIQIIDNLIKYKDYFEILNIGKYDDSPDNKILKEINSLKNKEKYTFITNDKLFRLKAIKNNIITEEYKSANPYQTESEKYNGFIELYTKEGKRKDFNEYPNSFHFDEKGKLMFYSGKRNEIELVKDVEL